MPLLLIFIAVPLIEIALFIQAGKIIGLGWILLIVLLTAVVGTTMVRRQGRDVMAQLSRSFNDLRDPTEPLAHGAMILFSGALLLTPGFFTDAVGFLLLVPPVREAVFRWLRSRINVQSAGFRPPPQGPHPSRPHDTVIDGDFSEVSPKDEPSDSGPSGWTRH